jgi:hypothetical protein
MMTRRGLIAMSVPMLALAACGTNGPVTIEQVRGFLDTAQSIVKALDGAVVQIGKIAPNAMTPTQVASIVVYIETAKTAIAGLQAQLAKAATLDTTTLAGTLNTIDTALNSVVSVAASIPVIPPPYGTILQAVAVALPSAEAFVNPLIVQVAGASQAVAKLRGTMTAGEAALVLQVAGR